MVIAASKEGGHPLQTEWVWWEHKAAHQGNRGPDNWKDNMSELAHLATVEDFWRVYNHLPRPSDIFFDGKNKKEVGPTGKIVEEYSFFKKGIEPEWGDPANSTGGEWFCRQSFDPSQLDFYWKNLLMGCIGETIEDGCGGKSGAPDIVNGARVVDKSRGNYPVFRIELWVSSRDARVKDRLQKLFEQTLTDGQSSEYKTHPKFEWKDHAA